MRFTKRRAIQRRTAPTPKNKELPTIGSSFFTTNYKHEKEKR